MKALLAAVLFSLSGLLSVGQTIYSKAFGDKNNKPIIFLHGGPGYNCANFEATTAQSLADKGFYVIVYDELFSADQINALKNIIGDEHLEYLDRCSHNVFIDQQDTFLTRIAAWTR